MKTESSDEDWEFHNEKVGQIGSRIARYQLIPSFIFTLKWFAAAVTALAIGDRLLGQGRIPWPGIFLMAGTILVADYVHRMADDRIVEMRQRKAMHERKRDQSD